MTGKLKVIFAGGGTGGHVYPALAVADTLASRHGSFEALFVGTRTGVESRVVPAAGYNIRFISSRGVRGQGFLGKIRTIAALAVGIAQSLLLLVKFRPDLVYGSGGYVSVATVVAAFLMQKTIVLQEQNSIPGLANRYLARCASRIYTEFEKTSDYLNGHPGIRYTGNPLRKGIARPEAGRHHANFGLAADKPVLLVFGGSQGARSINRAAADFLLANEDIQGIVQTGKKDYEETRRILQPAGSRVYVTEYIDRIDEAYGAADVALARSGALSVTELAMTSLPCVLVPYPWSADDHQVHNARLLVEAGGAKMIADEDLNGESLSDLLNGMIDRPDVLSGMRESLEAVRITDSADRIADDLESLLRLNQGSPTC